MDPRDIGLTAATSSLASLSHDLLDEAASGTAQPHDAPGANGDDGERYGIISGIPFPGPSIASILADPGADAAAPRRRLVGTIRRRRLQLHAVEQPRQKLHANGRLSERATSI